MRLYLLQHVMCFCFNNSFNTQDTETLVPTETFNPKIGFILLNEHVPDRATLYFCNFMRRFPFKKVSNELFLYKSRCSNSFVN